MDILFAGLFTVPAAIIVWIIFFFLLRKTARGRINFFITFSIFICISLYFGYLMSVDTGFLSGLGPLLIGCAVLTLYSIVAFLYLGWVRGDIKKQQQGQ
jgi:hypothetical protein